MSGDPLNFPSPDSPITPRPSGPPLPLSSPGAPGPSLPTATTPSDRPPLPPNRPGPQTDPSTPSSLAPVFPPPPARAFKRFVASLIDGIPVVALGVFASFGLARLLGVAYPEGLGEKLLLGLCLSVGVLSAATLVSLPALFSRVGNGRTLGHILTGTRMVRLDGQPLKVGNLLRRWGLGLVLPFLPIAIHPGFGLFSFAFLLFDSLWSYTDRSTQDPDALPDFQSGSRGLSFEGAGQRNLRDYLSGLQVVESDAAPLPGPGLLYGAYLRPMFGPGSKLRLIPALVLILLGIGIMLSAFGQTGFSMEVIVALGGAVMASGAMMLVRLSRGEEPPEPYFQDPAPHPAGFYPTPGEPRLFRLWFEGAWRNSTQRAWPLPLSVLLGCVWVLLVCPVLDLPFLFLFPLVLVGALLFEALRAAPSLDSPSSPSPSGGAGFAWIAGGGAVLVVLAISGVLLIKALKPSPSSLVSAKPEANQFEVVFDEVTSKAAPGQFLIGDTDRLYACPDLSERYFPSGGKCKLVMQGDKADFFSDDPRGQKPAPPAGAVNYLVVKSLVGNLSCRAYLWQDSGGRLIKKSLVCPD